MIDPQASLKAYFSLLHTPEEEYGICTVQWEDTLCSTTQSVSSETVWKTHVAWSYHIEFETKWNKSIIKRGG